MKCSHWPTQTPIPTKGFATHLHLCLCWCRPLWTVLYIIIEPIFISVCVCVGQCEHTITRPRENSDDTCVDICVLDKLFHPCLLLSIQGVCIRYWQLFVLVWWRVTQVQGELWRQRMDGILGLVRCHEQSYWCKLQTLLNENSIIIVRNEVAKVMFYTCLSVILFTGGGCAIPACIAGGIPACLAAGGVLSQHALQVISSMPCSRGVCYPSMHCRWYPSMPCSRGVCTWWGLLLGACLLQGGACSRGVWRPPPKADGSCCGRYASYWKAFLF